MPRLRRLRVHLAIALPLVAARAGGAQTPPVFAPLRADPDEPRFVATFLFARTAHLAPRIGAVGFGKTIGLFTSPAGRWSLGLAAGVNSQFDLASTTNHLMNTDFFVGVPFALRRGATSTRVRIYHQSSHLGEEFPDGGPVKRVLLSFDAFEALVAREFSGWRVYAGGEYRFIHAPADMKPAVGHAGLEFTGARPLLRLGWLGQGRLRAGLDGKSFQQRKGQIGWSVRAELFFANSDRGVPDWSLVAAGYRGPAPYGQFYGDNLSSAGVGIEISP